MKTCVGIMFVLIAGIAASEERVIAWEKLVEREGLLHAPFEVEPYTGRVAGNTGGLFPDRVIGTAKNGKREGIWRVWDYNGQLRSEATYKNGKFEGIARTWLYGQLIREYTLKNGEIVDLKCWDTDGDPDPPWCEDYLTRPYRLSHEYEH